MIKGQIKVKVGFKASSGIIFLLLLMVFLPHQASAQSWQYSRPLNITNSGSALADYQVQMTINTFSLISAGKMQPGCQDMRLRDSDMATNLSYWIESGCNTTATKIWVRVPSVPKGTKTIYMYYGAPAATSESNIDTTMDAGLRAFYYDGTNFNTFYGTCSDSAAPNYYWDVNTVSVPGCPNNQSDTLSIRWEGWIKNRGAGTHTFHVTTDDGSKLYIPSSSAIIDKWYDQGTTEHSAAYSFSSPVTIKYEWYENGGGATAKLGWAPADGSGKAYPIPSAYTRSRKYAAYEPTFSIGNEEAAANTPPTAAIISISPDPAAYGRPITFNGTGMDSDGSVMAYEWSENLTVLSTQPSFNKSDMTIGTHTVSFRVKDNKDLWSQTVNATVNIVVNTQPAATIDSISPEISNPTQPITFSGSGIDSDGTIVAYEWKIGPQVVSTQRTFSKSDFLPGNYSISLRVKDDSNTWSAETSRNFTILSNYPPVAKIRADLQTDSAVLTVLFSAFDSFDPDNDTIVSYLWEFDDNTSVTTAQNTIFHTYFSPGIYAAKLKVTDSRGLASINNDSTVVVILDAAPAAVSLPRITSISPSTYSPLTGMLFTNQMSFIVSWSANMSDLDIYEIQYRIKNVKITTDTIAPPMPGWNYRKPVTISNTGQGLTDYQVLITNPVYDETGLAASWHFDEGSGMYAADSSGNGKTGTFSNSPAWIGGKFGYGVSTTGNAYVSVPPVDIGTEWSIHAWFLSPIPTPAGGWATLTRGSNDHQILAYEGRDLGTFDNSGGTGFHDCGWDISTLPAGWHSISAAGNASGYTNFYIDGIWRCASDFRSTSDIVSIGNYQGGGQPWGAFDDVRIYSRILPAAAIQALYDAKAKPNYDDIRFTDSDGTTQLSYWREADGKFWVKAPSVPTGTKTIYVYYGNPSAASASSPVATMLAYDDWTEGSFPSGRWQINDPDFPLWNSTDAAAFDAANDRVQLTPAGVKDKGGNVRPLAALDTSTGFHAKARIVDTGKSDGHFWYFYTPRDGNYLVVNFNPYYNKIELGQKVNWAWTSLASSAWSTGGGDFSLDATADVYATPNSVKVYLGNQLKIDYSGPLPIAGNKFVFAAGHGDAYSAKYLHTASIRKYVQAEPAATIGSEETNVVTFSGNVSSTLVQDWLRWMVTRKASAAFGNGDPVKAADGMQYDFRVRSVSRRGTISLFSYPNSTIVDVGKPICSIRVDPYTDSSIDVIWKSDDSGSGIKEDMLEFRNSTSGWKTVETSSWASEKTAITYNGAKEDNLEFRCNAIDYAGNRGAYGYGRTRFILYNTSFFRPLPEYVNASYVSNGAINISFGSVGLNTQCYSIKHITGKVLPYDPAEWSNLFVSGSQCFAGNAIQFKPAAGMEDGKAYSFMVSATHDKGQETWPNINRTQDRMRVLSFQTDFIGPDVSIGIFDQNGNALQEGVVKGELRRLDIFSNAMDNTSGIANNTIEAYINEGEGDIHFNSTCPAASPLAGSNCSISLSISSKGQARIRIDVADKAGNSFSTGWMFFVRHALVNFVERTALLNIGSKQQAKLFVRNLKAENATIYLKLDGYGKAGFSRERPTEGISVSGNSREATALMKPHEEKALYADVYSSEPGSYRLDVFAYNNLGDMDNDTMSVIVSSPVGFSELTPEWLLALIVISCAAFFLIRAGEKGSAI